MALPLSNGCTRLTLSPPARFRHRSTIFATLSPSRPDTVNWVEATSSFFDQDTRPIMLFDGKKLLRRSGRAPDDISSVVLVEKDRSYIKSEAVLKIMEYLELPFPQLAFFLQFVPLFVRDFMYDNVANNRYAIFGYSDSCEI
ncbi:hypothetical protein F383_04241 [Gossypium arboreum]|uniref:Uncharacterized protein n=1 Tax=Gossypium arboreum TaxID=29729 RepID=A0A0B0PEC2_GOSAR|nr:hypothetical protein F383_04241 [Gossypium arboreum]